LCLHVLSLDLNAGKGAEPRTAHLSVEPVNRSNREYWEIGRIKCTEAEKGAECVQEVSQRPLAQSSEN
jgi:hypothetical protein